MRALSPPRWPAALSLAAATCLVLGIASSAGGAPLAVAPDGPGLVSHFDLARKDCLGTARNTTSKVWFTVANGVLSDVYYPTVDNTNVETLQYVVTDGSTFTDLQTSNMTSTVRALDSSGMSCEVTSTPANGKYRIVTDYVADPETDAVLMHVSFDVDSKATHGASLRLYLRFDPTVNGNGGGGGGNGGADSATTDTSTGHPVLVASDPVTATNAVNRDYAQPVYAALDAPFTQVSNGFAGTASDGLTQLDASHALTSTYDLCDRRQRRADGADRRRQARRRLHGRTRLRLEPGSGRADRRARAARPLPARARRLGARLARLRPAAERPAAPAARHLRRPAPVSCAAPTTSTPTC